MVRNLSLLYSFEILMAFLEIGSIEFTKAPGEEVKRGEETGYFAFGGSTIICKWFISHFPGI